MHKSKRRINKSDIPIVLSAVASGDIGIVNNLIANDIDINFENETGLTLLSLAIENRNVELVNLLLENGSRAYGTRAWNPLLDIIRSNDPHFKNMHLNLRSNFISDEGVIELCHALEHNSTITTLNLSKNWINETGAKILSSVLMNNHTITELNLHSNSIGDDGVLALCQALKSNHTLRKLDLNHNFIETNGATALSSLLMDNTTLLELNLYKNNIGDKGAKALSIAIQNNYTLITLKVGRFDPPNIFSISSSFIERSILGHGGRYYIGTKGVEALKNAMDISYSLCKLQICDEIFEIKRNLNLVPFYEAVKNGNLEIMSNLIQDGILALENASALKWAVKIACYQGNHSIVKYLIEKFPILLNDIEFNSKSPLQIASEKGDLRLIKYLLQHGADIHPKTKDGVDAIQLAKSHGHHDIVNYFEGVDKLLSKKNAVSPKEFVLLSTWPPSLHDEDFFSPLSSKVCDISISIQGAGTPIHLSRYDHSSKMDTLPKTANDLPVAPIDQVILFGLDTKAMSNQMKAIQTEYSRLDKGILGEDTVTSETYHRLIFNLLEVGGLFKNIQNQDYKVINYISKIEPLISEAEEMDKIFYPNYNEPVKRELHVFKELFHLKLKQGLQDAKQFLQNNYDFCCYFAATNPDEFNLILDKVSISPTIPEATPNKHSVGARMAAATMLFNQTKSLADKNVQNAKMLCNKTDQLGKSQFDTIMKLDQLTQQFSELKR